MNDATEIVAYLLPDPNEDDTDGARVFPVAYWAGTRPVLIDPGCGWLYHPIPAELADGIPLDARAVELLELHARTVAADALRG